MNPNNSSDVFAVRRDGGMGAFVWTILNFPSPFNSTEQARTLVPPRPTAKKVPVSVPLGTSVTIPR